MVNCTLSPVDSSLYVQDAVQEPSASTEEGDKAESGLSQRNEPALSAKQRRKQMYQRKDVRRCSCSADVFDFA